jgi:protein-L-isoaspartate(D-aspartate) O-methyltransferase
MSAAHPLPIARVRRRFAEAMAARAGIDDPRVIDAFAAAPREAFLPPPPWTILDGARRITSDPADLYADVLVALDPGRGVNNGSPSLHAAWIADLDVRPGARVAHLGAGGGHYSAILAHLAGPRGHVEAVEIDPALAARAAHACAGLGPDFAPVDVVVADATTRPAAEVDRLYVNFGVAAPARRWLERLAPDGRLILPLCVPVDGGGRWRSGEGWGLLVERRPEGYAARALDGCGFVWAEGVETASPAAIARLEAAFRRGGIERVRSLTLAAVSDPAGSWYVGDDWALGLEPPAARP